MHSQLHQAYQKNASNAPKFVQEEKRRQEPKILEVLTPRAQTKFENTYFFNRLKKKEKMLNQREQVNVPDLRSLHDTSNLREEVLYSELVKSLRQWQEVSGD